MKNFFKSKFATFLVIGITVILAGVAIFTAYKLYQMRQESVAPNAPVSVPKAAAELCNVDIVITIDNTGSMNDTTSGKTKIAWAKDAATQFVDKFQQQVGSSNTDSIRIGVDTFNILKDAAGKKTYTKVEQPLTSDFNLVKQKIAAIKVVPWPGDATCIECAITQTNNMFESNNKSKFVVLLSDGVANIALGGGGTTAANALAPIKAVADTGRASGITFFTIGFGVGSKNGYNPDILQAIANTPASSYYFYKPDAADWPATFLALVPKMCEGTNPSSSCSLSFNPLLNPPSITPTATATATAGPTGAPNSCGGTCDGNTNCQSGLYCYQGFCRNPSCPAETDCTCVSAATTTPTSVATLSPTATPEAALPASGTGWPTVLGISLGGLVLVMAFVLAL